jgi:uncharacterized damage-inducible protein DinB
MSVAQTLLPEFDHGMANTRRSFVLSHLIHHRGRLSVYLRLRDVALPGLYGPSADSAT